MLMPFPNDKDEIFVNIDDKQENREINLENMINVRNQKGALNSRYLVE